MVVLMMNLDLIVTYFRGYLGFYNLIFTLIYLILNTQMYLKMFITTHSLALQIKNNFYYCLYPVKVQYFIQKYMGNTGPQIENAGTNL